MMMIPKDAALEPFVFARALDANPPTLRLLHVCITAYMRGHMWHRARAHCWHGRPHLPVSRVGALGLTRSDQTNLCHTLPHWRQRQLS